MRRGRVTFAVDSATAVSQRARVAMIQSEIKGKRDGPILDDPEPDCALRCRVCGRPTALETQSGPTGHSHCIRTRRPRGAPARPGRPPGRRTRTAARSTCRVSRGRASASPSSHRESPTMWHVRVQRGKHRYVIPSNLDIKPYTSIAETPLRDLRNTGLRRAVGVAEPGPEGARAGAAAGRTRGAVRHFHARRYTQRRRDRVGVSERLWASPAGSLSAYTCRAVVCRAADTATVRDSAVVRPHEFTQRLHAPL